MEMAVFRKSEALDVRVSDIIVCTVSQELNFMAVKVKNHLTRFLWMINLSEWKHNILTTGDFT